jgi:pyruvate dehydrogenase (quinone)
MWGHHSRSLQAAYQRRPRCALNYTPGKTRPAARGWYSGVSELPALTPVVRLMLSSVFSWSNTTLRRLYRAEGPMADTVSDFLWERLRDWNVRRIYGYPGDGINGLMGAVARTADTLEFVQARHEEQCAFMACGHAKFGGGLGVCLATSGPGAIHLLNGLYDAKLDHVPVLAIVGQQARTSLGGSYQQEVDLHALFQDVAKEYTQTISAPEQLPNAVDRAVRIALSQRSPTCLIFPYDVQDLKAVRHTPHKMKMTPGSLGMAPSRTVPDPDAVARAAEILNAGEKVAILIGQGARNAANEIVQLADRLGAGIAKALLGKDVLPDDLSCVTGSIGMLGTQPSDDMMAGCDTLLMIGSSFPYSQFLPKFDQARGIQIDIDGRMIGLRYPMEVNILGDAAETVRQLLPLVQYKSDRTWRQRIEQNVREWWNTIDARASQPAEPLNPELLFTELSSRLPENAIIASDSGTCTVWYAQSLKLRRGMRCSVSGTLASMGCAVPYAIAAKFVHPDRPAIAIVGDGAMQMSGMAELLTVARYWKRWSDPRLIVLVLHNNDLAMVSWEMRAWSGNPKFAASQDLPECDYAAFAEMIGLKGLRVDDPAQVGPAWDEALASDYPVVIDAVTDPSVPVWPPHISAKEALGMVQAIMNGDPDAAGIVRNSIRGKLAGLLSK